MAAKNSTRKVLVYCTGIAVALGAVYVILVATGIISLDSYAEELTTIPNLSGMDFKVIYTSRARLFVTDYAVSVYTRRGSNRGRAATCEMVESPISLVSLRSGEVRQPSAVHKGYRQR
jgi:hypothetical protein